MHIPSLKYDMFDHALKKLTRKILLWSKIFRWNLANIMPVGVLSPCIFVLQNLIQTWQITLHSHGPPDVHTATVAATQSNFAKVITRGTQYLALAGEVICELELWLILWSTHYSAVGNETSQCFGQCYDGKPTVLIYFVEFATGA